MKRWIVRTLCILAGPVLSSHAVLAGTYTLLSPQNFIRGSGAPLTETVNFNAADTVSTYTLNVYNGGLQDNEPIGEYVSSSTIVVNGVQVFGPSDFNQNVSFISATVNLQTGNTLEVTLKGKPGGVVTIEITGEEFEPPVITAAIDPAANGNGWHHTDATVNFTCLDAISGIAACTAPVTVSSEGANQSVTGTATDNAGNTATTTVVVNLDKTAPAISAQPDRGANASGWYNAPVTVSFSCSDGLSGIATCTDPVTVTADGGNQAVSGTAVDLADNSATVSLNVNLDQTAPVITASLAPAANANGWHNTDVTVSFTCTDGLSGVDICPAPVTVSAEGAGQTVTGSATDLAGNSAGVSVTINLDKTAPAILSSTSPAANTNGWHNSDVTVSYTCTDGLSGVADCTAPQTVTVEGMQTLSGAAADLAGNTASTTTIVQLDKTAPQINITQPLDGSIQSANPFPIVFTPADNLSLDAGSLVIQINGQAVTADCTDNAGTFTCTPLAEIASVNAQLAVSVSDLAGNTGSAQAAYSIDRDGDGVFDGADAFPDDPDESADRDGDGIGDNADPDRDGDGISNDYEIQAGTDPDDPNDTPIDSDGNGIPDILEGPVAPPQSSTTTTYNALGLVASIDGPRTDVADLTTFEYDTQGNLIRTTNALGHVTAITAHDGHGRPLTIVDPNGTVTQLAYDARGRLLTRTIDAAQGCANGAGAGCAGAPGRTTTYDYDAAGNVIRTTLANGAFLENEYDAAQRLIAVADNLGNRIDYTLDAMGNRVQEQVSDPLGTLTRTLSRSYNPLNRLAETTGGAGQQTAYGYDANGNPTETTVDPLGLNQVTLQGYDALNRLTDSTDAANGLTSYRYDARDNLTSVTDPSGLTTTYTYDGLDRMIQQDSPDTGVTTYAYDAAGNRTRATDARGVTVRYSYDALNRLTLIDYPDNAQDVTYTYDTCLNGIGRLCQMIDESGVTGYSYDARGNRTGETTNRDSIIQTTAYAYDEADQLTQITYPSGRTVDYTRNVIGQIAAVTTTLGGTTTSLAENIVYQPFGPLTALDYGNGLGRANDYDLDYRLTGLTTPALLERGYTYDMADNITQITNAVDAGRNQDFGYDALNRLTTAGGIYGSLDYGYDANGNRLTETRDGQGKDYTYALASHHLLETVNGGTVNYSYDANGNTVSNTDVAFSYGDNNRLGKKGPE